MTVEQYKVLKKDQKLKRKIAFEFHTEYREEALKKYLAAGDEIGCEIVKESRFSNSRLNLPQKSITKKLRAAFEELILNDVAAVEGRADNASSMYFVTDLMNDMEIASGIRPATYCFIHNQDISDIRKGSFYLGWGGDVEHITAILEKNGLSVTYKDENTKLLIQEK